MRILRWRLKLAEYDYDVVYKAGKTNVNALSRNPVDFSEANCNIISHNIPLNPNHSEDAEAISKILEVFDEEDEDYTLYLSDGEEKNLGLPINNKQPEEDLEPLRWYKKT